MSLALQLTKDPTAQPSVTPRDVACQGTNARRLGSIQAIAANFARSDLGRLENIHLRAIGSRAAGAPA